MKVQFAKPLAFLVVVLAFIAVLAVVGRHDANAGEGDPPPPPFACPSNCDCTIPKASTVFCITNPYLCSTVNDPLDCEIFGAGASGGAYIAIGTGKKPDGCKSTEIASNCTEESFDCFMYGYCMVGAGGICLNNPADQGPAQQTTRKKSQSCATK